MKVYRHNLKKPKYILQRMETMKGLYENEMKLEFLSKSNNEAFARITVAAFSAQLDPTIEELADIKTAVSEAVTNSIIHGYAGKHGEIEITCRIRNKEVEVIVTDHGVGIADIEKAMQPLFTTKPEWERSGMGFAFMEAFMDHLEVFSEPNQGTKIIMRKEIGKEREK